VYNWLILEENKFGCIRSSREYKQGKCTSYVSKKEALKVWRESAEHRKRGLNLMDCSNCGAYMYYEYSWCFFKCPFCGHVVTDEELFQKQEAKV